MLADIENETAGPMVLVVEDEVLLRALLADELRNAGYTVMEAANGEEALNILRSPLNVDCVITDLTMPRMDGEALVRALQSEFPYLKVIMVSGKTPAADVQRSLHSYFSKPIEPTRIAEHLRLMVVPPAARLSAQPANG